MATHIINSWQFDADHINTLISSDNYIVQNYTPGDWNGIFNTTINGNDETIGIQATIDLSLIGSISVTNLQLFNIIFINGTITGGYNTFQHNCLNVLSKKYIYVNLDLSWNSVNHSGLQWNPYSFIEWRNLINSSSDGNTYYLRGSVDIPNGYYNETTLIMDDTDQKIQSWNPTKYGQWKINNVGIPSGLMVPMNDGFLSLTHGENTITSFWAPMFDMWIIDKEGDSEFYFGTSNVSASSFENCIIKCDLISAVNIGIGEAVPVLFNKTLIIGNWSQQSEMQPAPIIKFTNCAINQAKDYIIDKHYDVATDTNNQFVWIPPELPDWNAPKELFHKSLILINVTSPPSTGTPEIYTDAWGNIMNDIGACYCGSLSIPVSINTFAKKNKASIPPSNLVKEINKYFQLSKRKRGSQWIY
jgi:hypothetical protein